MARQPGVPRVLLAVHEHAALAALVAIAVHGITLLGDRWLHPGLTGIAVPFAMDYRPLFTALGIVAGYLAACARRRSQVGAVLGLTFYARRRLGTKRWRKAHRFTPLVYLLAVGHALGAGSDPRWVAVLLVASATPVLYLGVLRALPPVSPASRAGSG